MGKNNVLKSRASFYGTVLLTSAYNGYAVYFY